MVDADLKYQTLLPLEQKVPSMPPLACVAFEKYPHASTTWLLHCTGTKLKLKSLQAKDRIRIKAWNGTRQQQPQPQQQHRRASRG